MDRLRKAYSVMAENMNNPRAFLALVATIVIGTIVLLGWLTQNFVTMALGNEMMDKVQTADSELSQQITLLADEVKISNELLIMHMDKEKLSNILSEIRVNETERYNTEQFVSVNGANERTRERLRQLKAQHEDLELRRDCIINNNPLCD